MLSAYQPIHAALPSQRDLHPALTPLLALPIQAAKTFGPQRAARICDEVASGFLRAIDTDRLRVAGDLGLTAEHMEQAADWLGRVARRLERSCQ